MSALYIVPVYIKNRGKSAGIDGVNAGGDRAETVHYWAPAAGSDRVTQSGGTYLFWAENDDDAMRIIRREEGRPVSGKSYLPKCRVSAARVAEIEAVYAEQDRRLNEAERPAAPCPVQACPACGGRIRTNGRCANAEDGCPGAPAAAPYGFVVATGEPLTEREHQALTAMDARVVSPEAAAPTSGSGWTVGPPVERLELQFFSTRPGKGWQCAGVFVQPVDLARCPAFHRWVSVGSGEVLAAWTLPQAVYGAWVACERAQVREAQSDNPHARETAGRSLRAFEAACERYGINSADALTIFSLAGGAEAFKPAPEPAPAAPAAALPVPQPETAAPAQRCLAL